LDEAIRLIGRNGELVPPGQDDLGEKIAIYEVLRNARNRLLHDDWWSLGSHVGTRGFPSGGGDIPVHNRPTPAVLTTRARYADECRICFEAVTYHLRRNQNPTG
jgi:hypothetical protein